MAQVDTAIQKLAFPAKTTFTSGALYMAMEELHFGRDSVEKIVVLLTDGEPIDKLYTRRAAKALKQAGIRIVVVPIEGAGLDETNLGIIETMASRSKDDNIVEVEAFEDLAKISTVDTLIEDVCGLRVDFPMG